MYDDIRKNKIKTGLIVSLFLAMIFVIVYTICYIRGVDTYYAVFITMIFSLLSTALTYFNCDKIVLASVGAKEASREEYQQYNNIVDGLMVASGLEYRPRLYVMDSMQPNAFASGRNPKKAVICVTRGLLEKLDYYELEGVIAHELGHIANYDIRLSAVVTVMVGFIVMLSDIFTRRIFFKSSKNSKNNSANGILMLIGFILLILAPIFGKLMQLAISRRREFLADATAVQFTRNPDALISALKTISGDPNKLEQANQSTAHMYFASPFRKENKKQTNLFSTHPSIEARIEAIEKLK